MNVDKIVETRVVREVVSSSPLWDGVVAQVSAAVEARLFRAHEGSWDEPVTEEAADAAIRAGVRQGVSWLSAMIDDPGELWQAVYGLFGDGVREALRAAYGAKAEPVKPSQGLTAQVLDVAEKKLAAALTYELPARSEFHPGSAASEVDIQLTKIATDAVLARLRHIARSSNFGEQLHANLASWESVYSQAIGAAAGEARMSAMMDVADLSISQGILSARVPTPEAVAERVQMLLNARVRNSLRDAGVLASPLSTKSAFDVRVRIAENIRDVLAAVLSRAGEAGGAEVAGKLREAAGNEPEAEVKAMAAARAEAEVAQVRAFATEQVQANVAHRVMSWASQLIKNEERPQTYELVKEGLQAALSLYWRRLSGQYDSWLSYYDVMLRLGVKEAERLKPMMELAGHAGWAWVWQDVAVITERHSGIHRDAEGRLHCEDGYAIEWPGGWGFCVWHGTRVPDEWILDKASLTPEIALGWPNVEQRRAALEILTWDRVIRELGATVVDEHSDPQIGTLLRVDLPDSPGQQFLRVLCGTGRTFALPVPPEVRTALEANAWTYDVDPSELEDLEVRT